MSTLDTIRFKQCWVSPQQIKIGLAEEDWNIFVYTRLSEKFSEFIEVNKNDFQTQREKFEVTEEALPGQVLETSKQILLY